MRRIHQAFFDGTTMIVNISGGNDFVVSGMSALETLEKALNGQPLGKKKLISVMNVPEKITGTISRDIFWIITEDEME